MLIDLLTARWKSKRNRVHRDRDLRKATRKSSTGSHFNATRGSEIPAEQQRRKLRRPTMEPFACQKIGIPLIFERIQILNLQSRST